MNASRRFPIVPEDKNVFENFCKELGRQTAIAAHLPDDFPLTFRHSSEFGAKCFGSTSRQRLFAEAESSPPIIPSDLTREDLVNQLAAGIKRCAEKLAINEINEKKTVTPEQAKAIADAAPAIVKAVAKDLQYFAVDRFTFERKVLDRILQEARFPKFEFAITRDRRAAFIFELARRAVRELVGHLSESVDKINAPEAQQILRNSTVPLAEAMKQGYVPLDHVPVVLSDEGGDVVGVSFQHPVHLGVVPVCCADSDRFWAVAGALRSGGMAQSKQLDADYGFDDPTNIRPYFPSPRFPSMFNSTEDDSGPQVYFSQVSIETAIAYLAALGQAFNGDRVKCTEPNRQVLKGASLSSTDVIYGASGGKRRMFWGLWSFQSKHGQSKIMSASGTTKGIVVDGEWADQWYLRQVYWLEEADLPELGMPSDHLLAQQPDLDVTKVIPDGVEDFTRRALEHINRMAQDQQRDAAILAAAAKLQDQKKLLRKVKDAIEAHAIARAKARRAGLPAVGPDVLPPVN